MRLPAAERASVAASKVRDYLLCSTHPIGAAKARFFGQFGFHPDRWEVFAAALRRHAAEAAVTGSRTSDYGTVYSVDGEIETPSGRRPRIRTVWQVDQGAVAPRLITAYPLGPS